MSRALLLIDIQKDYFPGGKCELYHPEQAADHAGQILTFFRKKQWPIIHIQHISSDEHASFLAPGTFGIEIHESVFPLPNEKIIVKHAPDSFFQTDLQKELEALDVTELVVCGMMSHMCIDTTVRAAKNLVLKVTLIDDACTTKNLLYNGEIIEAEVVHRAFMAALQGTFAIIKTTDQMIKELNR